MNDQHIEARNTRSSELATEFAVGTNFCSIQEFVESFARSSSLKNIDFKIKQRNKSNVHLSCRMVDCVFKVTAKFKRAENFCFITSMNPFHSCQRNDFDPHSKSLLTHAIEHSDTSALTTKSLMNKMSEAYNIHLGYSTVYNSILSNKIKSGVIIQDSYQCVQSLISSFDSSRVYTALEIVELHFKRFFMVWHATIAFYEKNRKFITVDGTFLSGPHKGRLLVAVAQDCRDQIVLLGFAIVESENLESWKFFMANLNNVFGINRPDTIVMSDRDLGLISAVNTVAPNATRRVCVRHLAKNLKDRFHDKVCLDLYWQAVYSYDSEFFDSIMEDIKSRNENFHQALIEASVSCWAFSKCPVPTHGKNTSNSAESMNSALKKFVTSDICNLISSINNYNMKVFSDRRSQVFTHSIFPKQSELLERNTMSGCVLSVQQSSSTIFLVHQKFIVDIEARKCNCNLSFDCGIPCRHLCAVIVYKRQDPLSFVEKNFTTRNYMCSYENSITPISILNLARDETLPPVARRSRGRPRVLRFRAYSEK